jgi:hypothetical protein
MQDGKYSPAEIEGLISYCTGILYVCTRVCKYTCVGLYMYISLDINLYINIYTNFYSFISKISHISLQWRSKIAHAYIHTYKRTLCV